MITIEKLKAAIQKRDDEYQRGMLPATPANTPCQNSGMV